MAWSNFLWGELLIRLHVGKQSSLYESTAGAAQGVSNLLQAAPLNSNILTWQGASQTNNAVLLPNLNCGASGRCGAASWLRAPMDASVPAAHTS
jgi:hypothetical protein